LRPETSPSSATLIFLAFSFLFFSFLFFSHKTEDSSSLLLILILLLLCAKIILLLLMAWSALLRENLLYSLPDAQGDEVDGDRSQVFVWELNWRTEAHQFPAIITLMIYCMYYESITHKQPFELRCFEYVLMRHSLEG
jgi:hypothetical protein